jgi:SAM-dependent methyltransferase
MLEYYARRAPHYDAVYAQPERAKDIAFLKQYLPSRFANRSTLEVACGTGYWTAHLAATATQYCATDRLTEPLAIAKRREGVAHVVFLQADAYALPDTLGAYEGAFAGLWLSHVPIERLPVFLASLHRRLQHGARVVFIDNTAVQCKDYPIVETDARGNTFQQRMLPDGTTHRILKNFPTEHALREMVQGVAEAVHYRALENFWIFEYTLSQQA